MTIVRRFPRSLVLLLLFFVASGLGCGEPEFFVSDCRFVNPALLARIESRARVENPWFMWKGNDRTRLILQHRFDHEGVADGWEIDLRSGAVTPHTIPYVVNTDPEVPAPEYVEWVGLSYDRVLHPLIVSKTLRTEFTGEPERHWRPRLSLFRFNRPSVRDVSYRTRTGTWRVMFGARPLLERTYKNSRLYPSVDEHARIDPEGDLLACLCADARGSWVGIYHIKDFMNTASVGPTPLEKQ